MMRTVVLFLLTLTCVLRSTLAVEILRPEEVVPGMKGYGLSVFKGTKAGRFEVVVVGVLHNAMPKQDMILIRMSGADLEKHKVIAGMSGSPIYIDGKLMGALAYGWSFENEPLAGVTPIQNMLAEMKRPVLGPSTIDASVSLGRRSAAPFAFPGAAFAEAGNDSNVPRPLLSPLSLGGFGSAVLQRFASQFRGWGFMPVAAGGASSGALPLRSGDMEPGGPIGVQLIRGDMNATAVGTATYIEGNRILAFGHPFFQGGAVQAPAVLAEVHTIMSSVESSFKMASPIAEIGSMIGDWQSCIVADSKVHSEMIPISIEAENHEMGQTEHYAVEVMKNQMFTPQLVLMAIAQAAGSASGSSQDTTTRISLSAELAPITSGEPSRTIAVANTFFNPAGGILSMDGLMPLLAMFNTPFGSPKVNRIEVKIDAALTRQTADIRRAYIDKSEVRRGETVALHVVLKPFGQPEVTKKISFQVPTTAADTFRNLVVTVLAGGNAPPDSAPPDSLNDFLDVIEKGHQNTDLVALLPTHSDGMEYHGKMLKKLPPSAVGILEDSTVSEMSAAANISQLVEPTSWVLSGQATVRVPIKQE